MDQQTGRLKNFFSTKDHNFKIIDLKKNKGYGGGILAGVNKANSNIIAWTHGDLQCDLNDIIIPYKKYRELLNSEKCLIKGKRINRKFFDVFFYVNGHHNIHIVVKNLMK